MNRLSSHRCRTATAPSCLRVAPGFKRPAPFNGNPIEGTDRAEKGHKLTPLLRVFHDGRHSRPRVRRDGRALTVGTQNFDGNFLSLVFGFGTGPARNIGKEDIIRACGKIELSEPRVIFVRLNLISGPTRLKLPFDVDTSKGEWMVEWDVYHTDFDAAQGRDAWIDVIINNPREVQMRIEDLYFLKHPRATF